MPWCNCEDYPCCGHLDQEEARSLHPDLRQYCTGPQDSEEFFESLDPEEQDFVRSHLRQCTSCGEWGDPRNFQGGVCNMCQEMPERAGSPVAGRNTARMLGEKDREIERLQAEIEKLQEMLDMSVQS